MITTQPITLLEVDMPIAINFEENVAIKILDIINVFTSDKALYNTITKRQHVFFDAARASLGIFITLPVLGTPLFFSSGYRKRICPGVATQVRVEEAQTNCQRLVDKYWRPLAAP